VTRFFRDPLSGLTHCIGILLAIGGLAALLNRGGQPLTTEQTVSFTIFGVAMILLYTFSTLYHWLPVSGKTLETFRKLDHIMIFIFIAATYTPVCLVVLKGAWGWTILGSVWSIALAGLFIKIFWLNAPRFVSTAIYLLMGWFIVVGIYPLSQAMPAGALFWLAAGGFFYTLGAVIYAFKKPNPFPGVFAFHELFHIFVMLGSFSHFWMIYRYV